MMLDEARKTLDELDARIAELFVRRMEVIDQIAEIKFGQQAPVYRPEREKQVTDRLVLMTGDKYEAEILALYERIFELSRARQDKLISRMREKI